MRFILLIPVGFMILLSGCSLKDAAPETKIVYYEDGSAAEYLDDRVVKTYPDGTFQFNFKSPQP